MDAEFATVTEADPAHPGPSLLASGLRDLQARIAHSEALLGRAKAVLAEREDQRLHCGQALCEVRRLRSVLNDLHYQRRRMGRFEA